MISHAPNELPEIGSFSEITIEKIVPKGYGLGFSPGMTYFVPLAAPGDRLRVRVHEVKGTTVFAEIHEVVVPGPDRAEPPCPYFGVCGGCDFQQLNYDAQLSAKVNIIRDSLERIGRIDFDPIEMIASPHELGYRSRAQWHVDRDARRVGYYMRNSNNVVDIDICPKLTHDLQAGFRRFKEDVDWERTPSGKVHVDACVGDQGFISFHSNQLPVKTEDVRFTSANDVYFYSARSFFQANHYLVDKLVETATGGFGGRSAMDLYSGVGLFSLPLARRFERVTAVEGNDASVDFAEKNADHAGLSNIKFIRNYVGRALNEVSPLGVDLVLLDPPRSGTEKRVIQTIIKFQPQWVVYVACDPSILARDLRRLMDGGYRIDSITALDLFPQTHHVETVARLSRA